jgi:hypothetical protein
VVEVVEEVYFILVVDHQEILIVMQEQPEDLVLQQLKN